MLQLLFSYYGTCFNKTLADLTLKVCLAAIVSLVALFKIK